MVVACADLGEVDTIWRSDKARRALFFFRGSQYVVVVSPAVEVAVRSDGLGTFYFCWDDMAEAYFWRGGRGQGDLGVPCGFPRGGGEAPGAGSLGPVGGQGQVCGDWLCEVVGYLGVAVGVFGEPAVELVALPDWVLGGPAGLGAFGNGLRVDVAAVSAVEDDLVRG